MDVKWFSLTESSHPAHAGGRTVFLVTEGETEARRGLARPRSLEAPGSSSCSARGPTLGTEGGQGLGLPSVWRGRSRGRSWGVSPLTPLNPERIPPFRLSLELHNSQETS